MEGLALDLSHRHDPADSTVHCCCGRPDCAVLKKNTSVLDTVEKDVQTAAQLGKALLARHEAYMADAERDRLELTTRIERLEMDKLELEAENANKIDENRQLLDQLELLNNTISESDTKIKSLEASLLSSQLAVRRLESAASRAEDAERHLMALEEEQEQLYAELRTTREDARTHSQRFKEAQRGIVDMQDQLERMEKEAQQERERHVQVIGRMERQREVEKQLDTAAGRLKGAAAATKSLASQKEGGKVVGHFVRDLLQDNANLQLGIAELREMLMNSNDEIQSLRDQLTYHQPVSEDRPRNMASLMAELEPKESQFTTPRRLSQEYHVHHHYHVTPKQKNKKKRSSLGAGVFSPQIPSSAAASTCSGPAGLSSPTTPAILAYLERERASTPQADKAGWTNNGATASEITTASMPSSPRSNRVSSLFDGGIADFNSPASPTTSFDPMSPTWRASHHKRASAASFQSFQTIPQLDIGGDTVGPGQLNYLDNVIQEVDEDANHDDPTPGLVGNTASTDDSTTEISEISRDDGLPHPRLYRAHSHESIMSLTGGLDVHTLKSRPSQMTLRPLGGLEAVVTGVTAQPTLSRMSVKRSDAALRNHFNGFQSPRAVSGPVMNNTPGSSPVSPGILSAGINKLTGWRPWGGGASSNGKTLDVPNPTPTIKEKRVSSRSPGINQAGAIPGFPEYWVSKQRKGAPATVNAQSVDQGALDEGLQEVETDAQSSSTAKLEL
ncbi:unnamed protein product [Clonostachys rhizophaga]|uniref:Uncharacterized protein n=1 Tax=Clonostachys rhizophaga TaxID=160324 RepID=A0A9N9VPL9_9HYPO|nr:unnamed protein product [Clonostachys rhizophaga]